MPPATGPLDTVSFRGTAYNRYKIEWSTGQIWSEGESGQVPPNARSRVGATLEGVNQTTPEAIIITEVALLDASDQKSCHCTLAGWVTGGAAEPSRKMV